MPGDFYPGYDRKIHRVYVFSIIDEEPIKVGPGNKGNVSTSIIDTRNTGKGNEGDACFISEESKAHETDTEPEEELQSSVSFLAALQSIFVVAIVATIVLLNGLA
jgi:hypothetical protein